MLATVRDRLASAFGYDATQSKNRRKPPSGRNDSEDKVLYPSARHKLTSTSRDLQRNFAIAAWMIRKHLDYVSDFTFHSRTGVDAVDDQIEALMRAWFRPGNCDAGGRHPFPKLIRLAEARRTVDGDVGLLKLANGTLQGIESDRIRQPTGIDRLAPGAEWIHGVKTNAAGRALAYALWNRRRGGAGFEFARTVPASHICLHGFYERFDQVRGISPVAAALNQLRDVYENFDYALAKAKVSQLFALVFFRQLDDPVATTTSDDDGGYEVDFGRGPVQLDLDPGDDAKFLETRTPSSEFQAFTELVITAALKALDIPYSFYDEAHTNFFGSRGAWLHYERSCKSKRSDVQELLRKLTVWRMQLWIQDGTLTLPRGMTIGDARWEWVPTGMPWWDPAKEIRGDLMAIQAGLDNPQRICKERGRGDYFDNIDQIAAAKAYAQEKGVQVSFDPGQPEPVVVAQGEQS